MKGYNYGLLALAMPNKGVLSVAGEALKDVSKNSFEEHIKRMEQYEKELELKNKQMDLEFKNQSNPYKLEALKLNNENANLSNQKASLDLDTAQKTQQSLINTANANAKIAQSNANYSDVLNSQKVDLNNANLGKINAETNQIYYKQEQENLKKQKNKFINDLFNDTGRNSDNYLKEIKRQRTLYESILADENSTPGQKAQANQRILYLQDADSRDTMNDIYKTIKNEMDAKKKVDRNFRLTQSYKNMSQNNQAKITALGGIKRKMELLNDEISKIDPNFGLTGKLSAMYAEKIKKDTRMSFIKSQIDILKNDFITLSGDGGKRFKSELEALSKIVDDPYSVLGNEGTLNKLLGLISFQALGIMETARADIEFNRPDDLKVYDNMVEYLQPFYKKHYRQASSDNYNQNDNTLVSYNENKKKQQSQQDQNITQTQNKERPPLTNFIRF